MFRWGGLARAGALWGDLLAWRALRSCALAKTTVLVGLVVVRRGCTTWFGGGSVVVPSMGYDGVYVYIKFFNSFIRIHRVSS